MQMNYLQVIKKDIEQLYKEFIALIFSVKDNENLLKLDKKFNDAIKKSQDLMDDLEDQS